jgi:sulfate permease, SulP family
VGTYPDVSRHFIGQGTANVACGVFQGMPVGGSMSASSLNKSAGAKLARRCCAPPLATSS